MYSAPYLSQTTRCTHPFRSSRVEGIVGKYEYNKKKGGGGNNIKTQIEPHKDKKRRELSPSLICI
jgi:hypothetical protein